MKVIICPKCGEVPNYGKRVTYRYDLIFDADDEPDGSTEPFPVYDGTVKRCLYCDSKIKIIEKEEE